MYYIDIYYIFKCIHITYECCLWTVFLPYIKLQIINYIRVPYKIIWINVFIDAFLASYKLFIAKTSQNKFKNYIYTNSRRNRSKLKTRKKENKKKFQPN